MPVECPKCGSRYLRDSQPRTVAEKMGKFRFISPLRCLDCKTRFVAKTLVWSDVLFARCPTCLRMDLNAWSGKTYEPPFWMKLKISFGAKRWRCEYCRKNFVDFRPRKEVFSFKRWERKGAGKVVAEGRAKFAEDEMKAMAQAEVAEKEAMKAAREAAEARAKEEAEVRLQEEEAEREEQERLSKKKKKPSRLNPELEAPVARRANLEDRAAALAYTASLAKAKVPSSETEEPQTGLVPAASAEAPPAATSAPKFKRYSGAPELVYPKPKVRPPESDGETGDAPDPAPQAHEDDDEDSVAL